MNSKLFHQLIWELLYSSGKLSFQIPVDKNTRSESLSFDKNYKISKKSLSQFECNLTSYSSISLSSISFKDFFYSFKWKNVFNCLFKYMNSMINKYLNIFSLVS